MAPPPLPPRELVDDAISEILLRLPPDEPECLFRAALVCKPWLRILCDPGFLRRYRAFHGAPPILGLVDRKPVTAGSFLAPHFVPTAAVPAFPIPVADTLFAYPLDCRHGRILIQGDGHFLVSDPITGDRHRVLRPDTGASSVIGATAVFCAIAGCQHLDCHGGPFYVSVILADLCLNGNMWGTIYSSEMGAWSAPATSSPALACHNCKAYGRGALVGEGIYFLLSNDAGIIKYDWSKNCVSVVNCPTSLAVYGGGVALMVMENNSSLGLAGIEHTSLYLWSRRVGSEGDAEWVQCRVIDLEKMMPLANPSDGGYVIGFAEGVDVILIAADFEFFMMELKSGRVKRIGNPRYTIRVLPYMSFYTPDRLLGGPADL